MSDNLMSALLIIISGILLSAVLGWEVTRRIIVNGKTKVQRSQLRLKGIHNFYVIILILFIICGCVYVLDPSTRHYFGPIHWLDNDIINIAGLIILATAFVLIIRAQRKLDREIHLYYQDVSQQGSSKLVPDTENHLLRYIALVYVGLFIVVSTIVTLVLMLIALIGLYIRYNSRKYKGITQVKG